MKVKLFKNCNFSVKKIKLLMPAHEFNFFHILIFVFYNGGHSYLSNRKGFTLAPGKALTVESLSVAPLGSFTERLLTFTFMYPFLKNPKVFR